MTDVVISSKKEEVKEQTEKKTIIKAQVGCFKKKQSLNGKTEELRQFKASVNSKISKKTKLKEDAEEQLKNTKEEIKVLESTNATYQDQLKNTKDEAAKKAIDKKVDQVTKEYDTLTASVET